MRTGPRLHRPPAVLPPEPEAADVPLVVDMDGTLVRTDLLAESLFVLVRTHPMSLIKLPGWLLGGRAALKHHLAGRAVPEVHTLPYRSDVLDYLRAQKRQGRRLVLATAGDATVAERVAAELGLFDDVIASDGHTNLNGAAKRDRLVAVFGERGFDYLGNSRYDGVVWQVARSALVVGSAAWARTMTRDTPVVRVFDAERPSPMDYLWALRPHQWIKNLLVFVPVLAALGFGDLSLLAYTALAFVAFTLSAASVYLFNDLVDLPADRRHPHKRARMLASGHIGIVPAFVLMGVLALAGLGLGALLGPPVAMVLAAYLAGNLGYSLGLKDVPILDVLIIAAGYAARVAVGALAVGIAPSPWLLGFCLFLFFSLALLKRYAELVILRAVDGPRAHARGYLLDDLGIVAAQGIASGYIAVLVLALFGATPVVQAHPAQIPFVWLVCLLLLYWISHLWLMADRGRIEHDPVAFALSDRTSQVLMISTLLATLGAV